jgi:hypothetical protein
LYIFVDRPRLVSDLQEFLLDAGFIAAQRRGDGLEVSIPARLTRARRGGW